jgi:hypothetical protein
MSDDGISYDKKSRRYLNQKGEILRLGHGNVAGPHVVALVRRKVEFDTLYDKMSEAERRAAGDDFWDVEDAIDDEKDALSLEDRTLYVILRRALTNEDRQARHQTRVDQFHRDLDQNRVRLGRHFKGTEKRPRINTTIDRATQLAFKKAGITYSDVLDAFAKRLIAGEDGAAIMKRLSD